MKVCANPYHALDHKGRLAGACPKATPVGLPPARQFIGAKHDMVEGSLVKDDHEGFVLGRGDVFFRFESEPVEIVADQTLMQFYTQRLANGEIFEAEDGLPLEKLAKARAKAIADNFAAYGKEPDTSFWVEQFKADADVAPKVVSEEAEAKAKAEADAKAKAEAAKASAEKKKGGAQTLVTASSPEPTDTKGS